MGKSVCADLLRARGAEVIDTDDLARQVVEPGQPALAEVRAVFGADLVAADGRLRRDKLAQRVFANGAARKQLEEILHPRIRQLWRGKVDAWREQGRPLAVVVIPLLFETNAQAEFDATLCIACSLATQFDRLRSRGWTPEQAEQRIRAQLDIEKKMGFSDYVVWSEGALELHAAQLDHILGRLGATAQHEQTRN